MPELQYPSRFEQTVLAREAAGGPPAGVSLVIPTITLPGRPFTVKLAVLDEAEYPTTQWGGSVVVRCAAATPETVEVPFAAGTAAVARAAGVRIDRPGLFRLACEFNGRTFHSNPTCCTDRAGEFIFWGDPHVHTVLSDCHPDRCRSVNFCFVAAKWLAGLDWVSAADHVSNGRGSLGKWKEQAAASDAFDQPGDFVTLPGYEASLKSGAGGDNNVYMLRWPDMFVDDYEEGNIRTICEKMRRKLPEAEFFVVPHHTTRTVKHGEIGQDIYPGPQLMPVVEVHSKWGTSEYRGNPNALHEVHPGPSYVVDLLNGGLRLGFIGGTDTHTTFPGWNDKLPLGHIDRLAGITAVRSDRLTREAIFRGIRSRSCYAASGRRTYLDVGVAAARPGEAIEWTDPARPRRITVTAAAGSDIEAVEIVRNGQTIARQQPEQWKTRLDFTDDADLNGLLREAEPLGRFAYYYVRVTCAGGAQAWSSPVWLLAGG